MLAARGEDRAKAGQTVIPHMEGPATVHGLTLVGFTTSRFRVCEEAREDVQGLP